jgi:hypothetical protein
MLNLSGCFDAEMAATKLTLTLKHKKRLIALHSLTALSPRSAKGIGAVFALNRVAGIVGISGARQSTG